MREVKRLLLVKIITLFSCTLITGPRVEAAGVSPLEPIPAEYVVWHSEVEECLGVQRSFGRIEWFIAAEVMFRGEEQGGFWSSPNRITMRSDHVYSQRAVMEEIAHFVLQSGEHTDELYRCSLQANKK